MANRKVNIAELEFDQIKQNLKIFLQGQDRFSDYDFEGSNMSVLLDLLAYNTHYNAMYTNMALNEVYLDSASRRDSVVSLAKSLGYMPRSAVCARASINFTVSGVFGNPQFLTCAKNTEFYGTKDGVRYTLSVQADVTVQRNANNEYVFTNVIVAEGLFVQTKFEYSDQNAFTIPNTSVDVSTLKVRVQPSPSNTSYQSYNLATNLSDIDNQSLVYFLKEIDGGLYQMYFGDDILGKSLSTGNIINVEYYVCSGEDPNGIASLSYGGTQFAGGSVSTITLNDQPVNGGRTPESIEEIRFNAPNFYQTQNRAVTPLDYESLILSKVPYIEAVSVWGGENNNPPIYGKVFISAKTSSGLNLTYAEQQSIISDTIDTFKVVSVIPEFVNPEYIEVEVDVVAYYDPGLTIATSDALKAAINLAILNYNESDLQKFNRILRQSQLSRLIESTDSSIVSSVPRLKIYRSVTPLYNTNYTYNINVGNPFTAGTILTSGFYIADYIYECFIDDDSQGGLVLFSINGGTRTNLRNIGTVNYEKGLIIINSLNIVRTSGTGITIAVNPAAPDIVSVYNQIVLIDPARLKVNMIADQTTRGRALAGNKFQFTSSTI